MVPPLKNLETLILQLFTSSKFYTINQTIATGSRYPVVNRAVFAVHQSSFFQPFTHGPSQLKLGGLGKT
jgi:hypothetical protein